ncbi:MAG TPA: carboxyl transferase [Deltaproteobacteria bacterium]|nr:carboxyl transferase [Deltaproteobacteria bacterium]
MAFEKMLQEHQERKEKTLAQGGPEKIKRQHEKGRLTARERIEKLLDQDTFMELGAFCTSDMPGMEERTPADSLICGYGYVEGRRIAIIANDFTVLASTNALVNLKKMLLFKKQVRMQGIPLIWLGEAGGARMPDGQGAKRIMSCGAGSDMHWAEYTHFRECPLIMAAMGECYGVADFEACAADFVVQVKGSAICVSGPRALGRAIGQTYSAEEMGGWEVHSKYTGMSDQVAEDEENCFHLIKEFLDYMPSNSSELPPRKPVPEGSEERMAKILDFFPENRRRAYDMHKIIECIVDGGTYLELKPDFGKMQITCLARINGHVVGIIASNPIINAGATDTDALDKQTSFQCLCDSYNIPLIFLIDTPGHLTGKDAEMKRVGAKVVNNIQSLFQVTVPKIVILIRKGYGQALINMAALGVGCDFMVAWPTAEISFMDPEIGADVVFGNLSAEEKKEKVKELVDDISPYAAAQGYGIQDVIHPMDTRDYLINVLNIIRESKNKGIGNHLLANWPTKY